MKKKFILLFFLLYTGLLFSSTFTAKVIYVYDGDTVKISTLENNHFKIRFYGIDTPEKDQNYGKEAKDYTLNLLLNREIEVELITVDRYERLVARLYLDGICINDKNQRQCVVY